MTAPPRPRAEDQGAKDARLDDAALIERSWREPEAFARLYDRHAAPIHRYAGRRLGDQIADDVVAETFLAAFRRRKRYDLRRRDARPWLYGIAANVIGKYRRAEVRMLRAFARTGADPVTDDYSDRIDGRVSAAAVQRDLAAALAGLTAGDRDVLLLIAWADLSYEETAAALRIPVGTVRSRLNRARRKVREALGGQDPTSSNQEVPR
ncbi:MAG TPA: RNA polymerase sigma factor [Streptosporangiaceae bacterium]|jgi:RNA polymerase sigma factor (sigma-70 family)|nr:RNA polymerase sigma factor [Streptosporangiaceae bacterium]